MPNCLLKYAQPLGVIPANEAVSLISVKIWIPPKRVTTTEVTYETIFVENSGARDYLFGLASGTNDSLSNHSSNPSTTLNPSGSWVTVPKVTKTVTIIPGYWQTVDAGWTDPVAPHWTFSANLGWNAGARSVKTYIGDLEYTFEFPITNVGAITGISVPSANTGVTYREIQYGIYANETNYYVVERGVQKYQDIFAAGDEFKIEVVGTQVNYYLNGSMVYASATAITGDERIVDASVYSADDIIHNPAVVGTLSTGFSGTLIGVKGTVAEYLPASDGLFGIIDSLSGVLDSSPTPPVKARIYGDLGPIVGTLIGVARPLGDPDLPDIIQTGTDTTYTDTVEPDLEVVVPTDGDPITVTQPGTTITVDDPASDDPAHHDVTITTTGGPTVDTDPGVGLPLSITSSDGTVTTVADNGITVITLPGGDTVTITSGGTVTVVDDNGTHVLPVNSDLTTPDGTHIVVDINGNVTVTSAGGVVIQVDPGVSTLVTDVNLDTVLVHPGDDITVIDASTGTVTTVDLDTGTVTSTNPTGSIVTIDWGIGATITRADNVVTTIGVDGSVTQTLPEEESNWGTGGVAQLPVGITGPFFPGVGGNDPLIYRPDLAPLGAQDILDGNYTLIGGVYHTRHGDFYAADGVLTGPVGVLAEVYESGFSGELGDIYGLLWARVPPPTAFAAIELKLLTATGRAGSFLPEVNISLDIFTVSNEAWASANIELDIFTAEGIVPAWGRADIELDIFTVSSVPQAYVNIPLTLLTASGSVGEYRPTADIDLTLFSVTASVLPGRINANIDIEMPLLAGEIWPSIKISLPLFTVSNIPGVTYTSGQAWCSNLEFPDGAETTKFTNFNFIHIVRLGDKYYGVGSDGFYLLGSRFDNSDTINSSFTIAANRLDDSKEKRCPYLYTSADGRYKVSTVVDGRTRGPYFSETTGRRTRLARGTQGLTWAFKIQNIDGDKLRFNGIEPLFEVLRRRVP